MRAMLPPYSGPAALSDHQLELVQRYARDLPVVARDRYLRSLVEGLCGEPSDAGLMPAINRALDLVRAFQDAKL
jgi:hypothetical protein